MKFRHLVRFTRSRYLKVDYDVYRMSTCIHFSHLSFTTEMDSSLVLNFAFPCGLRGALFNDVSHTHSHIPEKTQRLNIFAKQVGLNTNIKKTEVLALNTTDRSQIQVENKDRPYTDRFTYLGSIISSEGGTELDIQSHLNKARNSLNMMSKVWRSSTYSIHTKLKLYHSCVLTTLL